MGLTSTLFTALSGLNTNQYRIDTVGDNIANLNTVGFKGTRALFQTQFAQTLAAGSPAQPPGSGGTNPMQIGMGTVLGAIQRNFAPGSVEQTGVATDMAIEGDGFFIVRTSPDGVAYTRDGSFLLDSTNHLVTTDGFYVQGYGVDEDFNVVGSELTDIEIPLGTLTLAQATETATFEGTLDADGTAATSGTVLTIQLQDAGGAPATGATALLGLQDGSGNTLIPLDATTITLSGATKGGREIPEATFTIGVDGTTVDDLAAWLEDVMGINTSAPEGASVAMVGDTLTITGNYGEDNALQISAGNLISDGTSPRSFSFSESANATGTSASTTFSVYDSLGSPVSVVLTMVLESKDANGTTWRFYAESADDSDRDLVVGTGTVQFDTQGRFVEASTPSIQIDRTDSGASDPLSVTLDFSNMHSLATTADSVLVMSRQDGFPTGTLTGFSVGADGVITGTFSNGLTRTLGQVALARFANPAGLLARANNLFEVGPSSGEPMIGAPTTMGIGRVLAGSLELSNVDLSRAFIDLITSSTGFSASGRVISASDELLKELLLLVR